MTADLLARIDRIESHQAIQQLPIRYGATYCRAGHEDGDNGVVMAISYLDEYERRDGTRYFVRRKEQHRYAEDLLNRPSGPDLVAARTRFPVG